MNMTALVELITQGTDYWFPFEDLAVYFFLAFVLIYLIKFGADRVSMVFVITLATGLFVYYGLVSNILAYGLILVAGGLIMFQAMKTMFFG